MKKLLIANRGEIACRIIKSAKQLGIHTIAIYSEIDCTAQHVLQADEAHCVGAAASNQSYLARKKIISIAKQTQADAIHPGYGFLAEDAEFAKQCQQAKIIFVGPTAEVIAAMGDKQLAKTQLSQKGIPVTPGYLGKQQDTNTLIKEAKKIGLPLLIKATAGGGGKGMRLVNKMEELTAAIEGARREAKAAFLNDHLILEKYLQHSRHIEVQLLCDQHGTALHLSTRDCSIQRRHQKVIEEAPAPNLQQKTWQGLTDTAVKIAETLNYTGAGTIEFLVDKDENFYFMEMNTRLQVEHPVTEMITGLDLVEWQLKIAQGESLPFQQSDIQYTGHAIEARIYAEDPAQGFLPSSGKLDYLALPTSKQAKSVRLDVGVIQGDTISPYYDPLIAKLITYGKDRQQALKQFKQALTETIIIGVKTNVALIHRIAEHTDFIKVTTDTQWLDRQEASFLKNPQPNPTTLNVLGHFLWQQQREQLTIQHGNSEDLFSPWLSTLNNTNQSMHFWVDGLPYSVTLDQSVAFSGELPQLTATIKQKTQTITLVPIDQHWQAFINGEQFTLHAIDPQAEYLSDRESDNSLTAPMPGTLIKLYVNENTSVQSGDKLAIMEAMKMEHVLRAPKEGIIEKINYTVGDKINEGSELLVLK